MSTYSPLTAKVMHTSKSESRRGNSITGVVVHHWAGTAGGVERLVHSSDAASANYIILSQDGPHGKDGDIIGSVPEERRAWTSGSLAADAPRITIEVQNSSTGGDWPVSVAALRSLVRLIADIADRYGWGTLTTAHVRGHREFQSTTCPGPYLWSRRAQIIRDAQAARGGARVPVSHTKPATSKRRSGKVPGTGITVTADGDFGRWTRTAYQERLKALGYPTGAQLHADGTFGHFSVLAEQEWLRRKGQTGHAVDGQRGPHTIRSLQAHLRKLGYTGHAIDGDFGRHTITSLQHALIDGKVT